MEEFENLQGFLEHISLVMDTDGGADADAVAIMTLHSAKGLEFDTVFLPGWEEGLFPHQRSLDDQGLAGLEEERRLAHVGITRARRRAKIYFATNRSIRGMWQTTAPSRFLDELPAAHVEVTESRGGFGWARGAAPRASMHSMPSASNYSTPCWQRAQATKERRGDVSHAFEEGGVRTRQGKQGRLRHGPTTNRGRARCPRSTRCRIGLCDRRACVSPEIRLPATRRVGLTATSSRLRSIRRGEKRVVDRFIRTRVSSQRIYTGRGEFVSLEAWQCDGA